MFDYILIPLSPNSKKYAGLYSAIISPEDHNLTEMGWGVNFGWWGDNPYASHRVQIKGEKPFGVLMHRIIAARVYGRYPTEDEVVDHIDNNSLNNRRENLRIATPLQNSWNKKQYKIKGMTKKYKGTKLIADGTRWEASIIVNRKEIRLGTKFFNEEDAARAYNEAALKYYGEFANLNITPNDEE